MATEREQIFGMKSRASRIVPGTELDYDTTDLGRGGADRRLTKIHRKLGFLNDGTRRPREHITGDIKEMLQDQVVILDRLMHPPKQPDQS